ncbi:hypothetical protein [Kineococcus arenarius]|uniref:hypothetical protein n=1 Tax=unclassified Kineococcus TaxID=2621656 RepID=UPI003D7CE8FB
MGEQSGQGKRSEDTALTHGDTYLTNLLVAAVGGAVAGALLMTVGVFLWVGRGTAYTAFPWGAAAVAVLGATTVAWAEVAAIAYWVSSAFL